jgi:hypothetical protein
VDGCTGWSLIALKPRREFALTMLPRLLELDR